MKSVVRQFNKVQAIHAKLAKQGERTPEDLLELSNELNVLMQMMNGRCSYPKIHEHMRALGMCQNVLEATTELSKVKV